MEVQGFRWALDEIQLCYLHLLADSAAEWKYEAGVREACPRRRLAIPEYSVAYSNHPGGSLGD